ncbi:MAG: hypothetical protein J7L26_04740, partial [Candidatus Aminicenantes bacterium]|nr:hypothetical protein [Candidatus Aminicenantes bacterium]
MIEIPWGIGDVDKHKKGLSPAQKKQWVKIANSVYDRCIKDGGDDAKCAPMAIRIANSKVTSEMRTFRYVTQLKETEGDGLWYDLMPVGKWKHRDYGDLQITENDI